MPAPKQVVVSGGFDDLKSRDLRFFEQASKLGKLTVLLWPDAVLEKISGKPDIYVVNEDGDKGGKREYCAELGIEYLVLKRAPAPGLPQRSSTDLRGF
jgi:glycerol-3-phosphate cytidylyltransferase-like family protein